MPLIGSVFYFSKSPRFIPEGLIFNKIISLSILSIALPILIFFLLKTTGKTDNIYFNNINERKLPLFVNSLILLLLIIRVFPAHQIIELHYFFLAILMSNIACFILALLSFKVSLHMVGVSGIFSFFLMLSIQYSININGTLALMSIVTGAVASSRLYLKAHSSIELITGIFIGITPQIIVINYWF
jgi:hypothetical protein